MSNLAAVFQIGSLGDAIVSVPVLRSLKEFLPDCSEYLLVSRFDTPSHVAPTHVFEMAQTLRHRLDYQGIGSRLERLNSVQTLLSKLRYFRPRYCVYLMPADRSPGQVFRDRLFFKAGGVRELVGFRALTKEDFSAEPNSYRNTEAYLRFRRLWKEKADEKFPIYSATPVLNPSDNGRNRVCEWLGARNYNSEQPLIALCPFSNYTSKNWPSSSVITLLRRLEREAGARTLILGGEKDRQSADSIVSTAGVGINACGEFLPSESAALLERCSLAICSDSGPMHLAGALGIPTLTTFSRINGSMHQWFPLGRNHTVLYRDVKCAGCGVRVCPVEGHPCMVNITADEVFQAAIRKLKGLPVLTEHLNGTLVENWNLPPFQA